MTQNNNIDSSTSDTVSNLPSSSQQQSYNTHEGEFVSILPSRAPLPITSQNSNPSTPITIGSPIDKSSFPIPPPSSISNPNENLPSLIHKWSHTHSILCVTPAPSKKLIFCGTQDSKILVFDIENYNLKFVIHCSNNKEYEASILCLTLTNDENFLFSAGSDSLIKVWNLTSIDNNSLINSIHCTHIIYSLVDIGDIFSIFWSHSFQTLFIGAQNASILWCKLILPCDTNKVFQSTDNLNNNNNTTTNIHVNNGIVNDTSSVISSTNENDSNDQKNKENDRDSETTTIDRLPHFRPNKFFDSKGPGGSINRLQSQHQLLKSKTSQISKDQLRSPKLVEVRNDDLIRFAHNGYVYCMDILSINKSQNNKANDFIDLYSNKYKEILISGGGDGIINVWGINKQIDDNISIELLESLENDESVLSMSIQDSYLYVGLSNSSINVWDLMTYQLIRSFHFVDQNADDNSNSYDEVLSLGIFNGCIFKASNSGGLVKFTLKSYPSNSIDPKNPVDDEKGNNNNAHSSNNIDSRNSLHLTHFVSTEDEKYNQLFDKSHNSVLTLKIFNFNCKTYLISGGLKSLCLWDISKVGTESLPQTNKSLHDSNKTSQQINDSNLVLENYNISNDNLLKSLKTFISFKTISKYPSLYLEDSRHCAQFLSKLLISLGASQTKLLPVPNANPVIYSRFAKNCFSNQDENENDKPTRVLWYGHYDVVDATASNDSWETDPFHLTAKDGNLYARGVSDNKGPTLAAVYAVSDLFRNKQLSCDVIFIIEGEEECGSIGFQNVIQDHKSFIGDIDWVMLSNSYWLDDETPCLNYGLRGVINASVTIQSDKPDRHSGVDGGVSKEPTMDLIQILGELTDRKTNKINLPHFYDDVLPLTQTEIEIYKKIENLAVNKNINHQDLKSLMAKWRNPSLTVHKIQVSGPNNNTVIPQTAKASISIRVVPNQDLYKIKTSLINYLNEEFESLQSDNKLSINIFHEAEPWLGDPSNLVYKILYDKIKLNWGVTTPDPLFIREGGSIPSIRFLEKCFNAPAAQIPCGQASDNAHLMNEKLRIINLYKLKSILIDTLKELGK